MVGLTKFCWKLAGPKASDGGPLLYLVAGTRLVVCPCFSKLLMAAPARLCLLTGGPVEEQQQHGARGQHQRDPMHSARLPNHLTGRALSGRTHNFHAQGSREHLVSRKILQHAEKRKIKVMVSLLNLFASRQGKY